MQAGLPSTGRAVLAAPQDWPLLFHHHQLWNLPTAGPSTAAAKQEKWLRSASLGDTLHENGKPFYLIRGT